MTEQNVPRSLLDVRLDNVVIPSSEELDEIALLLQVYETTDDTVGSDRR